MNRFARFAVAVLLLLVASAPVRSSAGASKVVEAACSMPHEYLVRVWRGTHPSRSAELLVIPKEPNFLGSSYPHSGPWDYLQRVPFLWYGPGYIPPVGAIERPVTVADISPTQGELLGFDFDAPDGSPLKEALVPAAERPDPPKLIVEVVWDAGGRAVTDEWWDKMQVLRSLIEEGAWYENATVGSSPSITPATHATMGTGAFPRRTGQVDSEFRLGPRLERAGQLGPALLNLPTFADLYDRAMGNEPIVGMIATVTWHLNMMSHGRLWGGGDKDIAIMRTTEEDEGAEGVRWNLQAKNSPFYSLPDYVNDFPQLDSYFDVADLADGTQDGLWRGHDIAELRGGFDTPARIPYQTRLIEEVISREGFGDDDVPDLFFTNYKLIDEVGHHFSLNGIEMGDTMAEQDAALGWLVDFLDEEVGEGSYVLIVTADHGHQYDPEVSGAFQITPGQLAEDLTAEFDDDDDDVPAIQLVRTSQVYIDVEELGSNGFTVEDVAEYVVDYTKADAAPTGVRVPESEADDAVFAAAIPKAAIDDLPCLEARE